jgi:hypothetical protein
MILAAQSCRAFYRGTPKAGSGKFIPDAAFHVKRSVSQVMNAFVSRETPA